MMRPPAIWKNPRAASSSAMMIWPHSLKVGIGAGVEGTTVLTVAVSVALLLPGVGSVTPPGADTVAVLLSEPLALALTVAVTV